MDRLRGAALRHGRRATAGAAAPAHPIRLHDPGPRRAARLARSYDDLERRIARLAEQEELAAIRPELNGHEIADALGIAPGPILGRAYQFLLQVRLDEGPIGAEAARERLIAWWAEQPEGGAGA